VDENGLKQYDFFPSLIDLCEMGMKDASDQACYAFTLYGMAMGYLMGCHPVEAWMNLGHDLLGQFSSVSEKDWSLIQTRIANMLEQRQHKDIS
jgi:hypothetical protein